jgi:ParB family chromosome partitioning protein
VPPIKVQPLNGSTFGDASHEYEIIYGYRRHRVCLELNIPINALIEPVDDEQVFEQMEHENRGRKNLSA